MANMKIIEKVEFQNEKINTSTWKIVLLDNLKPEQRELFLKRKEAIDLYFRNTLTLNQISEKTGIHQNEIRRCVKRCLSIDDHGELWGYRGVIPHKRIKKYERKDFEYLENTKLTGVFILFLDKYPRIKEKIISTYFEKDKNTINDPKINLKYLHKKFISWCHIEYIKENEYPFNTKDQAKKSLSRFLNKLENEIFSGAAKRRGESIQIHANFTGVESSSNSSIIRPFQRVQFDDHRIDVMLAITFKTPEGDELTKVMDRIWLLAIIDVATRVILGYYISLNKEYSSIDVLNCIKNAILPKEKMKLTIPNLAYPKELGYSSIKIVVEVEKIITKEIIKHAHATPNDYKKVIGVLGNKQKGKTTITDLLATYLSGEKKKVAVVDVTENRDFYFLKCWCAMRDNEQGIEALTLLTKGEKHPFEIDKYYHVFTQKKGLDVAFDLYRAIESIKHDYDIILVDINMMEFVDIYKYVFTDVCIVHDLNILDLKQLKNLVRCVIENGVHPSKLKLIINKYFKAKVKPEDILTGLSQPIKEVEEEIEDNYLDISHNKVFSIPFDFKLMENQINAMYLGDEIISIPEVINTELAYIVSHIYPLNIEKKGFLKKLFSKK